jgi:ABC-type enterochelin transport system substrate-binding protein
MQYKKGARVNLGTEAEPDYATVERVGPRVIIVRWENATDKMMVPRPVFERLVTPNTESAQ